MANHQSLKILGILSASSRIRLLSHSSLLWTMLELAFSQNSAEDNAGAFVQILERGNWFGLDLEAPDLRGCICRITLPSLLAPTDVARASIAPASIMH